MRSRVWSVLSLVFSALLAFGVMTLFHACAKTEEGMWMHCHTAQMYVFAIGLAAAAVSVLLLLLKGRPVRMLLHLLCIVLAVAAILMPGGIIHMCSMTTMRCYAVMRPYVRVMGILVAAVNLAGLIRQASAHVPGKER